MKQNISKVIEIPAGIEVIAEPGELTVKGAKGEIKKKLTLRGIKMEKQGNTIVLSAEKSTKRERTIIGTTAAHIRNMISGVENVFEYKLQVCSVHFPITVTIDSNKHIATIKNFLGEVKDRKAKLIADVEVKVEGDIITVTSSDKEKAGQTSLNLEKATRVRARDKRVFQDGIFMIEKAGRKI
ncbi:MAG: 50S ribosomal protein L6 [archaeon]